MLYFKAVGFCIRPETPSLAWGALTRFLEVGDDQYAVRQVEIFANGNMLRYDRSHWCDHFGQLLGVRFSKKAKWAKFFPAAVTISLAEFERHWQRAQHSDLWQQQLEGSLAVQWGQAPSWLPAARQ